MDIGVYRQIDGDYITLYDGKKELRITKQILERDGDDVEYKEFRRLYNQGEIEALGLLLDVQVNKTISPGKIKNLPDGSLINVRVFSREDRPARQWIAIKVENIWRNLETQDPVDFPKVTESEVVLYRFGYDKETM